MSIDDRGDGHVTPETLGGCESGVSAEVNVVDAVRGWRWFWAWIRGAPKAPAQPIGRTQDVTGFEQARQQAIDKAVDDEMTRVCGETEHQRKIREEG